MTNTDPSSVQTQLTALRTVFEESPDAVAIVSLQGHCIEQNAAHRALVGEQTGSELRWKWLPGLPGEELRRLCDVAISRGGFQGEFHITNQQARGLALRVTLQPVADAGGEVCCVTMVARDISSRRRFEQRVKGLAEVPRGSIGQHVYTSLARQIATALEVRSAFIARRTGETTMRILAVWVDGGPGKSCEVDIGDRPCGRVLDGGQPVVLESREIDVGWTQGALPFQMRSYAGLPITTASGQVLGVLGLVHDAIIPDRALAIAVLQVFADRIAIELERIASSEAMQQLSEDLDAATAELQRLADRDLLTNTMNRTAVREALNVLARNARANGTELTAILVDCDELGRINDRLGSAVGDIVLKEVARRLREKLRANDVLARIGGDEFLVLQPLTDVWEGTRLGEAMRLAVGASPIIICEDLFDITVSIGVISVPPETSTVEEVVALAHDALVASKSAGRNRVSSGGWRAITVEDPADEESVERVRRILLGRGNIRTLSQPIVRLSDEAFVGLEMLTRGPRGAFENPKDFFRLSLEQNMLTAVDLRCLHACISSGRELHSSQVHINVFPSTLLATPPDRLAELFEPDPTRFVLELSEQQFLGDPRSLVPAIEALRERGVRIAIDDVGFGRSSFETLLFLEPDIVKIDRSAVMGVANNPRKGRMLQRLVTAVQALDAAIVAEGVETPEELALVRSMNVEFGQGFYWGRPQEVASRAAG